MRGSGGKCHRDWNGGLVLALEIEGTELICCERKDLPGEDIAEEGIPIGDERRFELRLGIRKVREWWDRGVSDGAHCSLSVGMFVGKLTTEEM